MPALSNERWERFCEGIVEGKSIQDAYLAAGYKTKPAAARAHGARLVTNGSVKSRIAEMRQKRAEKAEITLDDLIKMAAYIYKQASHAGQYSASVAALKELGVLTGQRIERRETGRPGEFEAMSDDELRRYIEDGLAEARGSDAEFTDPRVTSEMRKFPN